MSDTPISDSTPHNVADLGMQIRRLERELNEANERIKRLEEMYEGVIGENPALLGSNVMGLLKRELTGTQKRIKQLEDIGHELRECASWVGHSCCQYVDQIRRAKAAIEAWDKEAKL